MFTPEELYLISLSLVAMKDLQEVDLMIAENDTEFQDRVKSEIAEVDMLMNKVKAMI